MTTVTVVVALSSGEQYLLRCEKLYKTRVFTYINNFVLHHTGIEPTLSEIDTDISTTPITKTTAKEWHMYYLFEFTGHAPEKVKEFFSHLERTNHAVKNN